MTRNIDVAIYITMVYFLPTSLQTVTSTSLQHLLTGAWIVHGQKYGAREPSSNPMYVKSILILVEVVSMHENTLPTFLLLLNYYIMPLIVVKIAVLILN